MGKSNTKAPRRAVKESTRKIKKKVCTFCARKETWIDYKDTETLRRYISDRGKIRARRVSGNCVQHQRDIAIAIKTSRELALLPYTQRTVAERTRTRAPQRNDADDDTSFADTYTPEAEATDEVAEAGDGE